MDFVGLLGNTRGPRRGSGPFEGEKGTGGGSMQKMDMKFASDAARTAEPWLQEAPSSDVLGGFRLGRSVRLSRSDVGGFTMQSVPDGTEYFIGETFGPSHWSCCWAGRGPTYHVIEGGPEDGDEQIQMHSDRLCCCAAPELDVVTMDGEVFASVDEQASCCCWTSTRVAVRDDEHYRVSGRFMGACCSCCTAASHIIEDRDNRSVGKIVHGSDGGFRIDFPEDAKASDKAAVLAAALLADLRRR